MEKIHFSVDPRYLLKQMIYQIYEQNINQYKEDEEIENLKYPTYDFLYKSNILTDEYIDKICDNMTDEDTLEIENTNEFRYNLWKSLINTDEYIDFISQKPILDSGVFDKESKREYQSNFGEHFLAVLSALEDADVDKSQYDNYIEENLYIYGKNYDSLDVLEELTPLSDTIKIKPINKREIVNDYQKDYWNESWKNKGKEKAWNLQMQ